MKTKTLIFSHIKDQLAAGKLEAAIREIKTLAPTQALASELKKYHFLLNRLRRLSRQGVMGKQEFHLARNKVHLALLEVLCEVEKAPSNLGLLAAAIRIPSGWKVAIISPFALALAAYLWLAFPYPFRLPALEETVVKEQPFETTDSENSRKTERQLRRRRVGP